MLHDRVHKFLIRMLPLFLSWMNQIYSAPIMHSTSPQMESAKYRQNSPYGHDSSSNIASLSTDAIAKDFRRKLNMLLAFIRQDVRESKV